GRPPRPHRLAPPPRARGDDPPPPAPPATQEQKRLPSQRPAAPATSLASPAGARPRRGLLQAIPIVRLSGTRAYSRFLSLWLRSVGYAVGIELTAGRSGCDSEGSYAGPDCRHRHYLADAAPPAFALDRPPRWAVFLYRSSSREIP